MLLGFRVQGLEAQNSRSFALQEVKHGQAVPDLNPKLETRNLETANHKSKSKTENRNPENRGQEVKRGESVPDLSPRPETRIPKPKTYTPNPETQNPQAKRGKSMPDVNPKGQPRTQEATLGEWESVPECRNRRLHLCDN